MLVKYTWIGDGNLDGTVNALDFNSLASNYGKVTSSDGWIQGDFNYDGTVNSSDFAALAADYGQGPTLPDGVVVPEPVAGRDRIPPVNRDAATAEPLRKTWCAASPT